MDLWWGIWTTFRPGEGGFEQKFSRNSKPRGLPGGDVEASIWLVHNRFTKVSKLWVLQKLALKSCPVSCTGMSANFLLSIFNEHFISVKMQLLTVLWLAVCNTLVLERYDKLSSLIHKNPLLRLFTSMDCLAKHSIIYWFQAKTFLPDNRLAAYGFHSNRKRLILFPFRVTKEIKLTIFQYKVIHNVLCTNNCFFSRGHDNKYCNLIGS